MERKTFRIDWIWDVLVVLLFIPFTSAYSDGLPVMNLWDLFVENVFGGFWMAVFGIAGIMFLIMAFGGMSAWSNLNYQFLFMLAMAMGYGTPLITIPLFIALMSWSLFNVARYWNTPST